MFSLALLGWILAVGKLLPRGAGSCDAPGSETCGWAAVWGESKHKWVSPREMLPLSKLQQEWVKSARDGAAPRCVCAARVPAPCGTVLGWRMLMKLLILTYFIPQKSCFWSGRAEPLFVLQELAPYDVFTVCLSSGPTSCSSWEEAVQAPRGRFPLRLLRDLC